MSTVRQNPAVWWGMRLGLVLLAVWLGHQAWVRNLDHACRTGEWPRLERCNVIDNQTPAQRAQWLMERLSRNPGDSFAAVELAVLASQAPEQVPVSAEQALATAVRQAPQDENVLMLQANRAIGAKQWDVAVPHLARLTVHHFNTSAAVALGQLIGASGGNPALRTALLDETRSNPLWLSQVVRRMPGANIPIVAAMPYLAQAMETRGLDRATSQYLIRQLKAQKQWLDAYSIWLYLWNRPVDLLFNGDFEQAFLPGGFDWEPGQTNAYTAGAQVQRSGRGDRGQVLEAVFTGKAMAPFVVRQDVLLSPGRYLFEGQYQASELRSSQGLVWVVRCASTGAEVARSDAMVAEGRNWRSWRLEFEFPNECGLGGHLELKPRAAFETIAGMKGAILFDRLKLERR